ncbi:hypothetical protein J6590_103906, partial [Homalodisca vitripennis]
PPPIDIYGEELRHLSQSHVHPEEGEASEATSPVKAGRGGTPLLRLARTTITVISCIKLDLSNYHCNPESRHLRRTVECTKTFDTLPKHGGATELNSERFQTLHYAEKAMEPN